MPHTDIESSPELIALTQSLNSLGITDATELESITPLSPPHTSIIPPPNPLESILPSRNMVEVPRSTSLESLTSGLGESPSLLHNLPIHYLRDALLTFDGSSQEIEDFLDNYESLIRRAKIVLDDDKVRGISRYVTGPVKQFIKRCEGYCDPNWEKLKEELLEAYDADRNNFRWTLQDIRALTVNSTTSEMDSMSKYLAYFRVYTTIADNTLLANRISQGDYDLYF
jgi:hypothetical protein